MIVEVFVADKKFSSLTTEEITLQPGLGDKKKLQLNLPEGSNNWTHGKVVFECDYFDHKGKLKKYIQIFPITKP